MESMSLDEAPNRAIRALGCLFVAGISAMAMAQEPSHWAFQPISDPVPPEVGDRAWPSQPLDRFVLHQFEASGLEPAPPAERFVLIRRVYFDLIGLPPTPQQINAFVNDPAPDAEAFAAVVEQLLDSPQYGERWGRHWLDVARYGDSNGSDENHAYPHAWRYRNWVIDAFNRDLPFDEFVRDQLAGDLVEPDDPDRIAATGFLAIGTKILAEKDPIKKKADIVDEQLDTIGRAFLGLAIGCARCHDHMSDPIPARDYYAMAGILHSTTQADREFGDGDEKLTIMAVRDEKGRDSAIHLRGDPHDRGETVPRGFLTGIGADWSGELGGGSGRLELADWLTAPGNPLTARVIANRVWRWHFGEGLVTTPDNFGTTGSAPSNRQLLDHLASELIRGNWSLKSLHRKILLSSAYRMGSDPEAGFPLRRLGAEEFRDAILHVSGSLDLARPDGSSIYIIAEKPNHVTLGRNRRAYDQQNYRSVYLPVVRNNIYDLFTLLDFPNGFTPVGQRANTTVPTQALLMMNSPWFMDQSRRIAESVRSADDPLDELHLRLFARPITPEERRDAGEFLRTATNRKSEDHAWALLCQTLLSSNDFLYLR